MISIPYNFPGSATYQSYDEIVDRIKRFNDYRDIGKDQSGHYSMYSIHLGIESNPTILITASMHGTEWQGTQYSLSFFEMLRDNTFPDKPFRDKLMRNFHLILIPMVNPWGLDNTEPHAILQGRYNSDGVDLNRDFDDFTQRESINTRNIMDKCKPFAYFDLHMIRGHKRDIHLILGNGQGATNNVRDEWADSWEIYSGQKVERWAGYVNLARGLSRRYMRDQVNDYTPHTLSYITEMSRPVAETAGFNAPLTDEEIFNYGMASLYLFFRTSLDYFSTYNKINDIVIEKTSYVRDLNGDEYPLMATITHNKELNGNQSISFIVKPNKVNNAFIGNISEMWEVVDDNDVTHKVKYAKKAGKGNLLDVEIKAIPLFYDVLDNSRIYDEYNEHMTAQLALNRIFDGLPFNFILVGQFDAVQWEGFGAGESRLETFKRALERYKMEFRIVDNTIYLEHRIGRDTNFMYRYQLNASNIIKVIDADEYWTYAIGYGDYGDGDGGEDWKNAKLIREYTSPLAKIPRIGVRHAPPLKNGNITTEPKMDSDLKEIVDSSLKISITTDIHDLRKQGYALAQPEIGDRVFIIDERIGLNEEVRVIDISVTKNQKGEIEDLKLTIGSEGLTKRHQSNMKTATKRINDLIEGRKRLPDSVYDPRMWQATKDMQSVMSELVTPNNGGLMSINKDNPNLVTIFNSAGFFVSNDGGTTAKEAMTGNGINASAVTTGTMLADFIAGGTLASLNGNLNFDMNNGNFDMKKASFVLGGGARIRFTDSGNNILFNLYDSVDGYGRLAGMGVGRSADSRYPFAYLGTYAGENMDTLGPHFSGFFTNTISRIRDEDSANSVVGRRLRFVSDTDYEKGLTLDFFGNTTTLVPWGGNFELGNAGSRFNRVFANEIRGGQSVYIRDAYGSGGLRLDTDWGASGEGSNLGIIPLNTGTYKYNLGRNNAKFTYAYITSVYADYLRGELQGSSAEKFKKNIEPASLEYSLEFVRNTDIVTFDWNESEDGQLNRKQVGFILDNLDMECDYLVKANDETIKKDNIIFLHQQVIQYLLKKVEAYDDKKSG